MDLRYRAITNMQWNLTSEIATPYDPMQIPLNMKNYANMMFSLIKADTMLLKYRKDAKK